MSVDCLAYPPKSSFPEVYRAEEPKSDFRQRLEHPSGRTHEEADFKETMETSKSDAPSFPSRQLSLDLRNLSHHRRGGMGVSGPLTAWPGSCKHTLSPHVFRQFLGNHIRQLPGNGRWGLRWAVVGEPVAHLLTSLAPSRPPEKTRCLEEPLGRRCIHRTPE